MQNPSRFLLFPVLALLMFSTRSQHFGSSLHLPDASLAVFFLAGFYLRGKFVFPLLLAAAVLSDYVAIAYFGVSDFCVSPAYVFLIPAYAAPWAAGVWLRGKACWQWASLLPLAGAWSLGVSLAFLVSDGSFYWLSGRYPASSLSQYVEQAGEYFLPYVSGPLAYLALAAALHGLFRSLQALRPLGGHETRR